MNIKLIIIVRKGIFGFVRLSPKTPTKMIKSTEGEGDLSHQSFSVAIKKLGRFSTTVFFPHETQKKLNWILMALLFNYGIR